MTNPNPRDEALVHAAREGNADALEQLLSRYKPLVKAKAAAYFISGGDRDDLIQEGMIGLYKAVLDYSPQKTAAFSAFASLCVNRQIQTAVKAAARQKHAPLNASLTLETAEAEATPQPGANPEALLISRESSDGIAHFIRENLSALEHDVLMLYMEGLSHTQIAARIKKTAKSVDNTLQRVRRKISRAMLAAEGE